MSRRQAEAALAAATARECSRRLAEGGSSILREIARDIRGMAEWAHYPADDVFDPVSQVQYFYHCHPAADRVGREHGHFHLFLRAGGMPPGVTPLLLPELAVADARLPPQAAPLKRGGGDQVCHLLALALDSQGEPIRLFTTNRWVTGETWYRGEDVVRMLDRFVPEPSGPFGLVNHWLAAILRLFRPQIVELLRERDKTVMAWRRRRRVHVFEDPRLEITSSRDIDLEGQLAAAAAVPAAPTAARRGARRLPRMAEGWADESSAP
ncbi:MAG: hypothetical protein JO305_10210 [Alphaproteobacteria bacterium]|nr:hypothetical protein [Alphaproteobacteria bacterium]